VTVRRVNFGNLDALRGLLAVYVALGHCRWLLWGGHAAWLAAPHQPWEFAPAVASAFLRYGREAVVVFFVLSGFFIHYRAATPRARENFQAEPFYRRRWHRLAAPYFFALAITVVCDWIGRSWWPALYQARTGDAVVDTTFIVGGYSPASVVPALMLLPSSLGRDFGSNGPLWSIAFEVVYYALYPLWLQVRRRSAVIAFGAIPMVCLMMALIPSRAFPVTVLMYYPIWLAGAWLAERVVAAGVPSRAVANGVALFLIGAAIYVLFDVMLVRVLAALLFGVGLVVAFGGAQSRDRVLLPLFEYFGVRSYTIYILHFPIVALLSACVFATFGQRPLHGWTAVAGALASIGIAVACFEVCERHYLHSRYGEAAAAP
jgi:peptidoglycan/LPS O-acetylase OafA/YrhL